MARPKTGAEDVRKLVKLGGLSIAVTIPIDLVRELRWKEKQKVRVVKKGKTLVISDWKR